MCYYVANQVWFGFYFWIWVDGFDLGLQLMDRSGFVIKLLGIVIGCGGGGCLTGW